MSKMEKEFDRKISALNKEFEDAPDTSIGLYRKETILLEMKNTKTQYQKSVLPASNLLRTLKGKRSAIERRDSSVGLDLRDNNQSTENGSHK